MPKISKSSFTYTVEEAVEELFKCRHFPRLRNEFIDFHIEELRFIHKDDEKILDLLSYIRENEMSVIATIVACSHPILRVWEEERLRYNLYYKAEKEISSCKLMLAAKNFKQSIQRLETSNPCEDEIKEKITVLERFQKKLIQKEESYGVFKESIRPLKIKIKISKSEKLS